MQASGADLVLAGQGRKTRLFSRLQRGFRGRLPGGGRAGSGGRMGVRSSGDFEAREGRGFD